MYEPSYEEYRCISGGRGYENISLSSSKGNNDSFQIRDSLALSMGGSEYVEHAESDQMRRLASWVDAPSFAMFSELGECC
jgi:hypothetical protein